ncbi:hypothetical protein [Streptomyces cyaneofuscatus]|uniref:hypothetical protein n=1 Tax=Streptomyces cyaneofuscatus TaxID=66883 RepID=UPI0004C9D9CD|nr:hypothetical protein [Streptomyces cyaneofuscatus]
MGDGGVSKGQARVVVFAAKLSLACRIIERLLDAEHFVGRAIGYGVHGSNSELCVDPEERDIDPSLLVVAEVEPSGRVAGVLSR